MQHPYQSNPKAIGFSLPTLCQGIATLFLALWLSTSYAVLQDEIQVYDDEINAKGEYSLELHVNSTPSGVGAQSYPGEVMNPVNVRITPEFAYGIGHDLELGLYVNSVMVGTQWNYAGFKGRVKWLPIQEKKGDGFFAGVNFELSNTLYQYEQSQYSGEARFIIGKHFDDWLVVVNPIFDFSFSQPYTNQNPMFNLASRVSREITEGFSLGVEYYSNLGSLNYPVNLQTTGQTLFAVAYVDAGPIPFQFGIGRGLNSSSDSWTVKAIFSLPIDF